MEVCSLPNLGSRFNMWNSKMKWKWNIKWSKVNGKRLEAAEVQWCGLLRWSLCLKSVWSRGLWHVRNKFTSYNEILLSVDVTIYSFSLPKHLLFYLWCLSYLIQICNSMEPWHCNTVTVVHLVIFLLLSCNSALIIRPLPLVYKYCSSSCIFPSFELMFIHTKTHSFLLSTKALVLMSLHHET